MITDLIIRLSETNHYKKVLSENHKNSKQLWDGSNEIINNKKLSKMNDRLISVSNLNGSQANSEEVPNILTTTLQQLQSQ